MYDFVTEKNPQYQREVSLLITFTMSVAGLASMPMRYLVSLTGIPNLDLLLSLGALVGSLVLTLDMFKDSSLLEYLKNWRDARRARQQAEDSSHSGPDMNNPLPN